MIGLNLVHFYHSNRIVSQVLKKGFKPGISMPGFLLSFFSMKDIAITFEHLGKKYSGRFSAVQGAGQNVWHLNDERNFYLGRLRKDANDNWRFDATPKTQEPAELADFFLRF